MANAKPVFYGVSGFVRMRTKGVCCIDRTAYTRELEKTIDAVAKSVGEYFKVRGASEAV